MYKRSSLFCRSVVDDEKELNNVDPSSAFSYQGEYQDDDPVFFTTSYSASPAFDNRFAFSPGGTIIEQVASYKSSLLLSIQIENTTIYKKVFD